MLKNCLLFFAAAAVLLLSDCRCARRQIVVKHVMLELPNQVPGFQQKSDQDRLSTLIKKTIDKNPGFYFDPNDSSGAVLLLGMIPPTERSLGTSLLLTGRLSELADHEEIKSFVDIKIVDGNIVGHDVAAALAKLLQNLYSSKMGIVVDNTVFIERINQGVAGEKIDSGELINAISVVGDAKDPKAIEPLINLLRTTTDLSVGNACIIALGQLRAEDAMQPIMDFVERKPAVIRRQAIIAAKEIASKLAAEWLLVMAYGYDDEQVRKEAREALVDVEQALSLRK